MIVWTGESAADELNRRGYISHYRKTKSANYRFRGIPPKEISISLARKDGVTVYVNRGAVSGTPFPDKGFEGVEVTKTYPKGYEGAKGNRGISESVARENPSLDPRSNDVLRLDIRDMDSFRRLLDWYVAK